jgi:hypothetical protein
VILLGTSYLIVLGLGFQARAAAAQPVPDPWFSILELLIIAMVPAMVLFMAAIHGQTNREASTLTLAALMFMTATAIVTGSVHFAVLVLSHEPSFARLPIAEFLIGFRWPSVAYALDILAWDLFFPLSMFCAAAGFPGAGLDRAVRLSMIASGLLSLSGLSGVVMGDMRVRNLGILGYGPGFLLVAGLLFVLLRREDDAKPSGG